MKTFKFTMIIKASDQYLDDVLEMRRDILSGKFQSDIRQNQSKRGFVDIKATCEEIPEK